ncbi:hypothetical protein ACIBQ1_55580 [Nonomuraea sp. NPDC050153]
MDKRIATIDTVTTRGLGMLFQRAVGGAGQEDDVVVTDSDSGPSS